MRYANVVDFPNYFIAPYTELNLLRQKISAMYLKAMSFFDQVIGVGFANVSVFH